ncbi:CPBP family intramembrane glutamic endopeptidase [Prochlorococcus marinus]|nr:CPBP family intramembrane glutamic endopeptidase [Prochlorococcus marinus]
MPRWKVFLAILSLLLTILIWQRGLQESFDRPSVTPKLALNQREIALLAYPSLPNSISPLLVGEDPELGLKNTLRELDQGQTGNRERLLLATLAISEDEKRSLLADTFQEKDLNTVRETLLDSLDQKDNFQILIDRIQDQQSDPLLYRMSCLAIGGEPDICVDERVSRNMAFRLLFSQLLPLLAILMGLLLFLRQGWLYLRNANSPWPEINFLPLSTVDMVLLIAGGFVVLGELVSPLIAMPFSDLITREIASPVKESLKVLIGYAAMTVPPLIILRQQISHLRIKVLSMEWLQWGGRSFAKSAVDALKGWLMVMPFVLLVSWLTTLFFGDPGGSNPLLDMVLSSKNYSALSILLITTVVMAPLFEELIFRGVLLPALVKKQGRVLSVLVSALIFALAHLSVGEMPPLFVLGIGLALLRLSSGRLLPCVLMHSLWNGVTFANLLILSA